MAPPPPSLEGPIPIQSTTDLPPTGPSALTHPNSTQHPRTADPSSSEPIDLTAPLKQAPTNLIAPEPEHCPGPESQSAGKSDSCAGCPNQQICASTPKGPDPDLPVVQARMKDVKHKVLVMSGKGGVGKSTFSAMLAYAFAAGDYDDEDEGKKGGENGMVAGETQNGHSHQEGKEEESRAEEPEPPQVGLMDTDICGPSIPLLLGVLNESIHVSASGLSPVYVLDNLCAMSVQFMLPRRDLAVIWRGAKKNGLIKKFLMEVEWGPLDWLVVDTPPGTSDEHLSVCAFLAGDKDKDKQQDGANGKNIKQNDVTHNGNSSQELNSTAVSQNGTIPSSFETEPHNSPDGVTAALLITTPQELSLLDVRKQISFCRKAKIPVLGLIENMSGFVCPSCRTESQIFRATTGGAEALAKETGVRFLGRVPLDPRIGMAGDLGESGNFVEAYPESAAVRALKGVVRGVKDAVNELSGGGRAKQVPGGGGQGGGSKIGCREM